MVKSDLAWKSIVRPYKSSFVEGEEGEKFSGSLTLEPLSRGLGVTLGNAMRRILLSSIESAAVTSVKISGVRQEFSSIPGVLEDVIDIIINLKSLDVKLLGAPRGQKFSLDVQGPGEVFAESIQGGSNIEIINPKHKICTITDDIKLSMEIGIERGVGYVPSEEMTSDSFGDILVDAQFSPVIDANYEVENISMGSESGIERLILNVQTNGSISPKQAIDQAGKILVDQASHFFEEKDRKEVEIKEESELSSVSGDTNHPILYQKIKDLDLPMRCLNCLEKMDIYFIGDLIQKTESQLRQTPHLGEKSVSDIKKFLKSHGLALGTVLPGWSVENGTPHIKSVTTSGG